MKWNSAYFARNKVVRNRFPVLLLQICRYNYLEYLFGLLCLYSMVSIYIQIFLCFMASAICIWANSFSDSGNEWYMYCSLVICFTVCTQIKVRHFSCRFFGWSFLHFTVARLAINIAMSWKRHLHSFTFVNLLSECQFFFISYGEWLRDISQVHRYKWELLFYF